MSSPRKVTQADVEWLQDRIKSIAVIYDKVKGIKDSHTGDVKGLTKLVAETENDFEVTKAVDERLRTTTPSDPDKAAKFKEVRSETMSESYFRSFKQLVDALQKSILEYCENITDKKIDAIRTDKNNHHYIRMLLLTFNDIKSQSYSRMEHLGLPGHIKVILSEDKTLPAVISQYNTDHIKAISKKLERGFEPVKLPSVSEWKLDDASPAVETLAHDSLAAGSVEAPEVVIKSDTVSKGGPATPAASKVTPFVPLDITSSPAKPSASLISEQPKSTNTLSSSSSAMFSPPRVILTEEQKAMNARVNALFSDIENPNRVASVLRNAGVINAELDKCIPFLELFQTKLDVATAATDKESLKSIIQDAVAHFQSPKCPFDDKKTEGILNKFGAWFDAKLKESSNSDSLKTALNELKSSADSIVAKLKADRAPFPTN